MIPKEAVCFFKDGDQVCAVWGTFVNIQESPAGFGNTANKALLQLIEDTRKYQLVKINARLQVLKETAIDSGCENYLDQPLVYDDPIVTLQDQDQEKLNDKNTQLLGKYTAIINKHGYDSKEADEFIFINSCNDELISLCHVVKDTKILFEKGML